MSKSTCHSHLSSTPTTPDLDINNIQLQNLIDFRNQINTNDKRSNNINYVRHVLRKFFSGYIKKSTSINSTISDENLTDQILTINNINDNLISPILIHSCLQFHKHEKFSGELLFDWFLIHFENRYEDLTLIKQVILQCCTCLLGLNVLKIENNQDNDLFQAQNLYSWTNNNLENEDTDIRLSSSTITNDFNHHLIESKEYKYKPSTATTILDILRTEYNFHSDVQQIETNSVSIQVDLIDNIRTIDKSIQTDSTIISSNETCFILNFDQMSSFIVTKTDSNSKPSSPILHRIDKNTVRQAMQKLFLHDNLNDPLSPGVDDDVHSPISSSNSFKNNHAKFSSELLLEWITLNSDTRNSNSQALVEQVQSCLHPNSNINSNHNDPKKILTSPMSTNETKSQLSYVNKPFTLFPSSSFTFDRNINDDIRSLLSDLIIEIDRKSTEASSFISSVPLPPPPPPFITSVMPPPPPPLPSIIGSSIPPPPPPMMPGFGAPPQLPQYLCKKQKYSVTEPIKKVQWSKVNPYTIKKESIWVNVDEAKYVNDTLFSDIRKNFASKVAPSRQPINDLVDKSKELRVLDAKAAQNFAIMFSQLKVSPIVFREWMLSCDNENLKYDFLKQLEKYLPTSEELKTLADYKNENNDLQYSEQYFCAIGDIKRLKQRLKTLLFKANYKETVEETDKAFVEVRNACDHVRHSIHFKKMLELILTIGNYMNSSGKSYEPVHGFNISFLPKLHSTKANDGRRSLLHFIVQAIEDKHRDLLAFSDEFYLLADGVSKINILELQKQPQEINRELKNAREELLIAKENEEPIEGDRFTEAIEDFITRADNDVARLEQLDREMTNAYQNLCDFLAIDLKNYSLAEFFTDLKLFCTFFSTCLQEIRVWREQAARAAKTSQNLMSSSQYFVRIPSRRFPTRSDSTDDFLLAAAESGLSPSRGTSPSNTYRRQIQEIPDDTLKISRRLTSRVEDLIERRKKNRGLTPTQISYKKRSQS
ncbi:unnamed protein product [Rotaria sordida]|uniref:FH2 domain-containing protein n=2 Tax=Rotaria sordida TaxID=392033 RepID=A0A814I7E3_9BILA|nr:unnamed protein product [Rotaria sordida]